MKKKYPALLSMLFLTAIIIWIFYAMMPQTISKTESLSEFSTNRALKIVKTIAAKPHFVTSDNHNQVANYLFNELKKLNLEPSFEEGFTLTEWGNLAYSKNIVAKIKGSKSEKSLLLLSHYDSAPHSYSYGASDDAAGIATILEGVRAYVHNKKVPNNDIIILFTDAEELGLNGAALFVTKNNLCKNIGVAINFEARGTSGPSFMLMEVNKGNAKMVKSFAATKPNFSASNSLMYSIYKMLPNDTDLTVFREHGKIQGFNFAFIDDHFNYHTPQDNYAHLNKKSLAHQGEYIMPLLNYFSNADINNLNDTNDYVYLSTPIGFFYYPFSWVLPINIIASIAFLLLLILAIGKRVIDLKQIGIGFLLLITVIVLSGSATYFGWQLILKIYPNYSEILHGFTYNGHDYIYAFLSLTLAICFLIHSQFTNSKNANSHSISGIFLWILINFGIAIKLQGAGFFVIPLIFGLLILTIFIVKQKNYWLINLLLSIPTLIILIPLLQLFPIGLGLKILFGSSVLLVLIFSLLLPIFGSFENKKTFSLGFIILSVLFLMNAHVNCNFEAGKAKPNSLLYILDADANKACWTTYDKNLDDFTNEYLAKTPKTGNEFNKFPLFSKYNSSLTFNNEAEIKNISRPEITFEKDSLSGNFRFLKIKITPTRKVNRYDIFANEKMVFFNFKSNGVRNIEQKTKQLNRKGTKVLTYYVTNNIPLELEFAVNSKTVFDMDLLESSFDLMSNDEFNIKKRKPWMMPKPFVLNDAIVIKQHIHENISNDENLSEAYKKMKLDEKMKLIMKKDSLKNAE